MTQRLAASLVMMTMASGAAAEPMQLSVNGQSRSFLLERPAAVGPRPTIIVLHGAGGGAEREAQVSGLGQLGPRQGFAVVFPEGRGGRWNFFPPGRETQQDVQFFLPHGGAPDDVGFLRALIADLVKRGIADPERVYLAGRSLGGVMTLRMVCADGGRLAAVGLLISAMPEVTGADCHPEKPVPVLMINGTADRILPYAGGPSVRGDALWPAERLLGFFRRLNRCGDAVEKSVLPARRQKVEIERSADCVGGPVILYRAVGMGHEVPADLNASQLLLDFFRDKTAAGASAGPAAAQAASVRKALEKYGLLGSFAHDCARPAGGGNLYIIQRLVDDDHARREQMSGPSAQDFAMLIDRVAETRPNEIDISGEIGTRRFNMVVRVESNRMRTMESASDSGEKIIAGGRFIRTGGETPWFSKCG